MASDRLAIKRDCVPRSRDRYVEQSPLVFDRAFEARLPLHAIAREEVKNRYRLSKLESEKKVTVGDNPGLDLVLNNRNEHYRVRCLLVGNRLYVLSLYVRSPEKGNADQIAKEYFDSFKLK